MALEGEEHDGAARPDLRAMKRIIYLSRATSFLSPFTKSLVGGTVLLVRMFATVSSLLTSPPSLSSTLLCRPSHCISIPPNFTAEWCAPLCRVCATQGAVPDPQPCSVPPHQPALHHEGGEGEGPSNTPRGYTPFRLITLLESPRNSLARASRERWGIFRQTRAEGAKSCCGMIFKHSSSDSTKLFPVRALWSRFALRPSVPGAPVPMYRRGVREPRLCRVSSMYRYFCAHSFQACFFDFFCIPSCGNHNFPH